MFRLPSRVRAFLAAVAAAAVASLVVSCGTGGGRQEASAPAKSSDAAPSGSARRAPDFALEDITGKVVRLSDFDGQVRLVDFWATWCAPCREEIPTFNELQEKYGSKGFKLLAVAMDDDPAKVVPPFVDAYDVGYTVLLGKEEIAEAFGPIVGYPTAFLVDRQGRIVDSWVGVVPRKILEDSIRSLLEEGRTS